MSLPKDLCHWTSEGTFRITPKVMHRMLFFELWFKEINLGTYEFRSTAAESISEGKHDQEIGLKLSALGVPSDPDKWSGFR
jgi:hypothetical protein